MAATNKDNDANIGGAHTGGLEELTRTSRILELILLIAQAPRRYLRRDLAKRFEVSERMIQKDLEVIRHGVKLPLSHDLQGYYFESIPHLPVLQYSLPEALALLLAVQAARQMGGIDSGDLSAAVARLEALFPPELARLLAQVRQPLPLSANRDHRAQMLALIEKALAATRKLSITYETRSRAGECSRRTVHPYYLLPYVRSWHLIAFCEMRGQVLIFKVDRILEARLLAETYRIPEDFDLTAYLGSGWGLMRGAAGEAEEIVLRFSAQAGSWVSEEFWHPSQQVEEQEDGSVLFRLQAGITPELVRWLLYYGDQVQVEKPESLREAVREEHRRAGEL